MDDRRQGKGLYRIKESYADQLREIKKLYGGLPVVTIEGDREAHIAHHAGLLRYTEESVIVAAKTHQIEVRGADLQLAAMDRDGIRITGRIIGVELRYHEL